ncbi:MAG TPA: ATP-binding protein, partial [Paracoccaceae bacterium]|nr:ATP-binding protein [Paracoccaceae bacterium]
VATVRAIHLPLGVLGMSAIVTVAAASNTAYWMTQGSLAEWAFSSFCILLGVGYFVGAMRSNHRLHRETAEGRQLAQEADAAKGRFLAQMSHELRTPLNAILGMGRAERAAAADPGTRDRMDILVHSAEGLGTLLDDVLDMSAVEAGRLPIRPRPASPAQEIAATAALWRPAITAAGQTLTIEIDPALAPPALIDAQRLRQCLSNLLSNAARHAGPTSVALRARRIIPHADADPVLRVEVADGGAGLDPALRDRLFQPFERGLGPQANGEAGAGSGLGLSISRGLARQMGGELRLFPATPGVPGLCFVLTLPLPPAASLPAPAPVPGARGAGDAPPPGPPTPAPTDGLSVLVVDDIATNRLVAATYLRMLGARPVEAATGPEALVLAAAGGIDLVLLDMNMPVMDGAATFRALRALPGPASRLPVVAMTADAMEGHRDRYMALGLDGYVPKPVSPQVLAAELAAVLARRPRTARDAAE